MWCLRKVLFGHRILITVSPEFVRFPVCTLCLIPMDAESSVYENKLTIRKTNNHIALFKS